MEKSFKNISGISLITGSALMILTMVLHPSGGDREHILKMKNILIGSHSIAIVSMPLIAFGLWGLSKKLSTSNKCSMLAFSFSCFGLFAAMMAAAINGLALPLFLEKSVIKAIDTDTTSAITTYGLYLNKAMDYIMIYMLGIAICIWSILIIRASQGMKWMGYYGIVIILAAIVSLICQLPIFGVRGFSIVVFAIAGWIIMAFFYLLLPATQSKPYTEQNSL